MPLNHTETSVSQSSRAVYQPLNHIPTLIPSLQYWLPLRLNISRNRFPGNLRENFCQGLAVSPSRGPNGNTKSPIPWDYLCHRRCWWPSHSSPGAQIKHSVPFLPLGMELSTIHTDRSLPRAAVCSGTWDFCPKTALNHLENNTHRVHFPSSEAE